MERKTPLYDRHTAAGGKLVPFAGWLLPVQYSGVIAEHRAVRTGCGLFDVSHMGELLLRGPDALANLNRLMTNDFSGMADGQARYSPMCYEDGGVVDDLIVYRCSDTAWLAVVNASNTAKDRDWMAAHLSGDCTLEDLSDQTAQLALQGPGAEALLRTLTADLPAKNYTAVLHGTVDGRPCLVSRTGYTGEDGFELYCAPADAPALWDALTAAGALPCGLGARDTLRLEAAMPLYGHELSPSINPYEAGLGIFVKLEKPDFIGKAALERARPVSRRRVGLQMTGRGIAREGCPVYDGGRQVGVVTSGTHCPWVGQAVALALVVWALLMLAACLLASRWLDLMPMGPAVATALGIHLGRAQLTILLLVAVLTASATMVIGPLSFAGLLAPHLARLMGLVRARWHLLGAAGCGALLMVSADWIGQQILFPQEVPVGLVSTLLGGAYFMWCLRRL